MACFSSSLGHHFHVPNSAPPLWVIRYPCLLVLLTSLVGMIIIPSSGFGGQEPLSQTTEPQAPSKEDLHEKEIQDLRMRVEVLESQQNSILDEISQRVILGGYGAIEFETFAGAKTSFEGKLEVLIAGQIHDRIRFYNEIDLGIPEGEAHAEQAYVDLLIAKWINIRGGVVLVPFGKFNLDHFDPRRDLTDRPLVARQIVPTTWGDLGASIFGLIPWTPNVISTYEVAVINGLTDNFSPTNGGLQDAKSPLRRDNNGQKAVVGRATVKLADQYEIGVSGYRGASSPNNGKTITGFDIDLEFKPRGIPFWEDFELKGELATFDINKSRTPSWLLGYYIQVNYHFWPSFLNQTFLGEPYTHPIFTLVGRYDHARISTKAGTGNLTEDRFTLGLNYRPIENYVLKTEYQINNGGIERKSWNGFIASIAWLF